MFTTYTYQDYENAGSPLSVLLKAVEEYRSSADFQHALEASSYFRGENPAIARKTILRARKIETRDADGRRRIKTGT